MLAWLCDLCNGCEQEKRRAGGQRGWDIPSSSRRRRGRLACGRHDGSQAVAQSPLGETVVQVGEIVLVGGGK